MKKLLSFLSLLLIAGMLFSGCLPEIMVIPDNDTLGEPKFFEKDGIRLLLSDKLVETPSQMGFDAYYSSNFCGVVVLKEEFSLEEGLADRSLEDYVRNVIANNGHTDIEPQTRDGLWFYVRDSGATRSYSYSFKGSNAFWVVQYLCRPSDAKLLEDVFFLWASAVEVE